MNDFDVKALTWDDDPVKVDRAKQVAEAIRKHTPLKHSMSGLDYGCGTGLLGFHLHPYLSHMTFMDNSDGMLEVLNRKIEQGGFTTMKPVKANLMEDPPVDEKYDIIVNSMVLHHIPDTDKILNIFHSMLHPGGYLCIADLDKEDGSFHGKEVKVHHGFNRTQLAKQFEQAGFILTHNDICFELPKKTKDGEKKWFPVFLMVGQKQ